MAMAIVLSIRDNTMVPALAVTVVSNGLAVGPVFRCRPNASVTSSRVIVGNATTRSWSVVNSVWTFATVAAAVGTA